MGGVSRPAPRRRARLRDDPRLSGSIRSLRFRVDGRDVAAALTLTPESPWRFLTK
jgi:hypothetical protein